jgi:hypothetical protein
MHFGFRSHFIALIGWKGLIAFWLLSALEMGSFGLCFQVFIRSRSSIVAFCEGVSQADC